jgi:hypothetical protein
MFIAILTLLSALSISGVAIFYSVIGLATIFPGAFVPVVIMGGVLEVGKLITASWLYRNWKFTPFMLRTYLTTAVIILSLITSMGIFGFLSKAHLEQNLASDTLIQRIQILEDKIDSEKNSILRQNAVIDRLEKSINRSTGTADGDIEVQQQIIADANEKLKTLLTVETNTVRDLNDRLKVLDKNVSDILTSNKSFFNEEKAAADLKASQKAERGQIAVNVKEAQDRIAELKLDHKAETAEAKTVIANMRSGSQDNKSTFTEDIETAENKIFDSQGKIDLYIVEKQPLEKKMLTLEAEIGPVKYIAALAVDWGITDQVETSKAVRWVILLLIVVFDPLAVLLLIAANQSLMRRFPPEAPKPQEVIDLEKPDDEGIDLKWNEMMDKSDTVAKMEEAMEQLQEWKDKLEKFNSKVPKPDAEAPVEIIQEDKNIPHIDLKGQKKTEDKEIVADNTSDGFDPDEHLYDMETNPKKTEQEEINAYKEKKLQEEEYERKIQQQAEKEKQEEKFKKREQEELEALEEFARKAREDEEEQTISEQIEEVMEPERTRPDFTEVIEPEVKIEKPKDVVKNSKPLVMRTIKPKVDTPPKPSLSNWQRAELLDNFHKEHGNFKDVKEYVQNEEQSGSTNWKKIKSKTTTEEDYHSRMEQRIEDLITKVENKEIELSDLSDEDQKVILDILNQKNG